MKEKERRKLNNTIKGTRDSECYDTVDQGRDVTICECTTDLCNAADSFYNNNVLNTVYIPQTIHNLNVTESVASIYFLMVAAKSCL